MARIICGIIGLLLAMTIVVAVENPEAYLLAAQDKISVTVLRHDDLSKSYTIPPDGVINFPRAGNITVIGKTTTEVAADLKTQLRKTLRDPDVTVMLAEARQKNAYALGSVAKPGQYPLAAGARITELLAAAGDLVGERNELTASLVRGKTIIPVDLQAALSGKSPDANVQLQEGDVLWIQPPTRITVVVSGQVKNPGVFKMRADSTLVDALAQAGDLLDRPEHTRLSLIRGAITERVAWGDSSKTLKDGDVILVEKEAMARVYVNGHVRNPGAYELADGGGVLEAIALAGGTLERPALSQVTIVHARDGSTQQINLTQALLHGKVDQNPRLYPGDQVIVPESTAKISVLGMVKAPGSFLMNENKPLTVVDAISMAGGTDKRAKLSKVTVVRIVDGKPQRIPVDVDAILKKGQNDRNILLKPDDIVYVPETDSLNWDELLNDFYRIGIVLPALP